jgi:hypothetical protein
MCLKVYHGEIMMAQAKEAKRCHPDDTQIAVVGCAEWESEYFKGVSKLHVRTLDKFHERNRQVSIHSSTFFILFHTVSYCFILFPGMLCNISPTVIQAHGH